MREMKKQQETKRPPRRLTMQLKLNALVICSILLVAVGLMSISYYIFCQRVDDKYNSSLSRAAEACANNIDADVIRYFWACVNTDEYRAVRERALAAEDEELIRDWMRSRPGWYEFGFAGEDADPAEDAEAGQETWTLLDDCELIRDALKAIRDYFDVDAAYYQYSVGNGTWNIMDIDEDLFYIGTDEEPIEEFAAYKGNVSIPPTVYHSNFGWLLTVMEPIVDPETGETVAAAGVDLNMTEIVGERYAYLRQSLVFVAVLLAVTIFLIVHLLQRTAVRPLRQLANAATRFAEEDRPVTRADVIDLDIRSNDEVGDLYREIRSMESRILDYTENLTRVTAEKERVNTELRTASGIQEAMLPHIFPAFPDREDFDLYACMTPAKAVGGDFYDFFLLDDTHLALLIADVSDKASRRRFS